VSLPAAVSRADIAGYVSALFEVYIAFILIYILVNLVLSFGLRPPYSRTFDAVMNFLRDVCEPYLRIFRKFIPAIGPLDLSPMVALIVLFIVDSVVTSAING
jgi:uncharacterized protein YggT (Ycf19 family)